MIVNRLIYALSPWQFGVGYTQRQHAIGVCTNCGDRWRFATIDGYIRTSP
jgi:hypothetical protein